MPQVFSRSYLTLVAMLALGLTSAPGLAAPAPSPAPSASPAAKKPPAGKPAAYDDFVKDATITSGLMPIVQKEGKVYLVVTKDQLDRDFVATSVPSTGLGGAAGGDTLPGSPYIAPARILRFVRSGDDVVLRWRNTIADVKPDTPQAISTKQTLPNSIVAVEKIAAEDESKGTIVIPAAPFLGDVADYGSALNHAIKGPQHFYHLDPTRSFFEAAKAFPENDVFHVTQTWVSQDPNTIDNAPDARSLDVGMTYNIIAAPSDGYMPRLYDPRVGYFSQPLLDFASDTHDTRNLYYITRWNFGPSDPTHPAPAKNPLVYYLSNNIPEEYRPAVRAALLTWNAAFEKIGILDAVRVEQQPSDPSWDPEDIRHNMIRWISTSTPQYGAEALITADPRTGEDINVGVNFDAIEASAGPYLYRYLIAPARGIPYTQAASQKLTSDFVRAVILHESGHDFGLQHNFIGSMAYTAKDLQSASFTQENGIVSSVMEYEPFANLWPKGTPQGEYEQLVLGPYDYYAIRYGYEPVPGAATPRSELPTLSRWASNWNDPRYRFASDEDAGFGDGHAIDPRVQVFDLTNHPLAWLSVQLPMMHGIMDAVGARFPEKGKAYDEARRAFLAPLRQYLRDAIMPANVIGGEYLSRATAGEAGGDTPLSPVSRSQNYRAFGMLDSDLFSDRAWAFNPSVLRMTTYSEVSSFSGGMWAYNPTPRHDVAVVDIAATAQDLALNEIFAPLTLQRIDELQTKYPGNQTMSLTDLFDWSRAGIYGDLRNGSVGNAGVVRRNLQMRFARRLAAMWLSPAPGTPPDAQALARLQLSDLVADTAHADANPRLSELARAHVEALHAFAQNALAAHPGMALGTAPQGDNGDGAPTPGFEEFLNGYGDLGGPFPIR